MKKMLNILILLIVIHDVRIDAFTLKSSQMCKFFSTANGMKSIINNECVGNLKFKCTDDHCSMDKETCDLFLKVKTITRSFPRLPYYERKVEEFKNFVRTIKYCPIREKYISILSHDVCIKKNRKITQRLTSSFISWIKMPHHSTKHFDLPCVGEYSVACDQMTCGANQKDCMAFNLSKKINDNSSKKHKNCDF